MAQKEEGDLKKKIFDHLKRILPNHTRSSNDIPKANSDHFGNKSLRSNVKVEISSRDPIIILVKITDYNCFRYPEKLKTKILFCKAVSYFLKNVQNVEDKDQREK